MIKIQTLTLKSYLLHKRSFAIFKIDYNITKINKQNENVIGRLYFKSFDYENNNQYYMSENKTKNKSPYVIHDYNKALTLNKLLN
jgi:hypothetical protein